MRVAVLGGGYAGLLTARRLERSLPDDVELVVVDDTGDHLVQHELHRAIRVPELADAISIPLAELLDRATVRVDTVDAVDRERRTVVLDGGELSYDVCVVALGAETAYHGLTGVREHATPLKRLADAETVRASFLDVVERVGGRGDGEGDAADDADDASHGARETATVVVGGAGLSGVQVAGELAAFAEEEGVDDAVDVVVLERLGSVAPSFPANFRDAVRESLLEAGVDLRTEATVVDATADAVELESGESLAYDQFVWTGGIAGSAAMDGERPRVRATLALDDRTFVVGDAARVVDADGEAVPASAQSAVRAANVAARNVAETVAAEREGYDPRLEQWRFDSPGWLVSVGDDAVAQFGPQVLTGRLAGVIKSSVGVGYLAEHGSLREALGLLRTELDTPAALFSHLPDEDGRP